MSLFFDIGCNVGQWIEANLQGGNRIIGLEPNPIIYRKAKDRYKEGRRVLIYNLAASYESDKEIDFYIEKYDQNAVCSTASPEWVNNSRFTDTLKWDKIQVKTIALNDMIERFGEPEFIKIDTEGYEYHVIRGLYCAVCPLCFEWAEETGDDIIHSIDHLHAIGYNRFFILSGEDYTFRPSRWISTIHAIDKMRGLITGKKENWGTIYADL